MSAATTSAHSIASRLRADINDGRWEDGAVLRQDDLADAYGASRIPVREALSLLRDEGLVVIEPNRGAYVARLSADEAAELFDLRVLLEAEALRHAIPKHTAKSLILVAALQSQLELEDGGAAWIAGDRGFHEALYAPCARPHTLALVDRLRGRVERYGLVKLRPGSRREAWAQEHRKLLAAVDARDEAAAIDALTIHLRETQAAVCAALSRP